MANWIRRLHLTSSSAATSSLHIQSVAMFSPTLLNSLRSMQTQQSTLSFAQLSTPLSPKLVPLGTQKVCLGVSRGGQSRSRAGQNLIIVSGSRSVEDSQLGDGPVEPPRPGFSREPHSSLSYIAADDPAAAPLPQKKIKISPRRMGRQRRWKKATPAQAFTGAVVGGLWAALALKGTTAASEHLASHPLAHELPMGMTNNVNEILLTGVTGFGAFAVLMFSISSFGLATLALKLILTPKPPSQ